MWCSLKYNKPAVAWDSTAVVPLDMDSVVRIGADERRDTCTYIVDYGTVNRKITKQQDV
jgi:hypothetical protein